MEIVTRKKIENYSKGNKTMNDKQIENLLCFMRELPSIC